MEYLKGMSSDTGERDHPIKKMDKKKVDDR